MAKRENNVCGVYKISCEITDNIYIGSSKNVYKRFRNHKYLLNKGEHHNFKLQQEWSKYGCDYFKFELLEECEDGENFNLEQKYLDKLKPFVRFERGYNINETTMPIGEKICNIRFTRDEMDNPIAVKVCGYCGEYPITDEEYFESTKEELRDNALGFFSTEDLYDDLVSSNPDWV